MKKPSLLLLIVLLIIPATTRAQEPVEITFTHIFTDDIRGGVVQAMVDAFMAENPHISVTMQVDTDNYGDVFNSALLAADQGNPIALVQVEESFTQLAIDSQFFVPITQAASDDQLAGLDEYLPQVIGYYTVGGELWGIPWNSSNPLLYYNADYFRAAGLDPADPPNTFDEMLAACEAILAAEIDGVSACANWPMASWFPEQWMAMQGEVLVDNNNGRDGRATEMFTTAPGMVEAVTWWGEMAQRGYYTYSGRQDDYTGDAIIFIGKSTAMHINSTAGLSNFISFAQQQEFELGVAPLLQPTEADDLGVTMGGASLFVSAGLSEAETQAAVDLVFFLTNAENDAFFHRGTGYLPNRASTIEQMEADGFYAENPFFRIAVDQLLASTDSTATRGIVLGTAAQARPILLEAIQSVVDGGEDPSEALAAAKTRIDADIADYNSLFD